MSEPIRILHVIGAMNCGGAETMVMNLYRNIDREKIQFDFLVHTEKECFFDNEIRALGGKIYSVPRFNLINLFRYKKELRKFFKEHPEYTAVHGHIGSSACVYLSVAKKHGMYAIAHSHNTNSTEISLKNILYRLFSLRTRRVADHFFACSRDAGIDRFGIKIANAKNFSVLPNAIQTENFVYNDSIRQKAREDLGFSDEFVVGHIGRFSYQKNHEYLLEIFAEILKIKKDAILLLLGDGELRDEIERKISELNLNGRVVLAGVRKDANRLLQAMDCFVFPSHFEGLGIVAIEAQCNGLPCFINEELPQDLNINSNLSRLSIKASPKIWAKEIIEKSLRVDSKAAFNNVKNAGYDIKNSAEELAEFYSNIQKGEK